MNVSIFIAVQDFTQAKFGIDGAIVERVPTVASDSWKLRNQSQNNLQVQTV